MIKLVERPLEGVENWHDAAFDALVQVQAMSGAVRALANIACEGEISAKLYPLMQAIDACTASIDFVVDPIVDRGRPT